VHRPRLAGSPCATEREVLLVPLVDADAPAHAIPLHTELRKPRRVLGLFSRGSITATCDLPRAAFVPGDHISAAVTVSNNATNAIIGEIVVRVVEAVVTRSNSSSTRRLQERTLVDSGNLLHDANLGHGGTFNQAVDLALPVNGVAPSMDGGAGFRVEHCVEVHVRSPGGRSGLLVLRCRFTLGTTRGLPPHVRPRSVSSPFRQLADIIEVAGPVAAAASASSAPSAAALRGLCVVCQDGACVQCVVPCGHRCLCDRCATALVAAAADEPRQCPICRRAFQSIIRVYDP